MKILYSSVLLAFIGGLQAAEPIPAREPGIGVPRPGWWLDLWMDHVVVIEGIIEWKEDREPEIQISADHKALEAAIGKKDAKLFQATKKFRLGRIKPKKLLFASPGITSMDLTIAAIAKGEHQELPCLLPIIEVGGRDFKFNDVNGGGGIFIFRYGSMMTGIPLVFSERIPNDGMVSAEAVFQHRDRFDHRKSKNSKEGEQAAPSAGDKPSN